MNQTSCAQQQRIAISRKRIAIAIAMLPITLPFALMHRAAEWWHTKVSQAVVHHMRATAKRRDQFFESIAPKRTTSASKESQ